LVDVFPTFRKIDLPSSFKGQAERFVDLLALEYDGCILWPVEVAQERAKVAGCCEHGNEPRVFVNFREFLDQMKNC
jgi:hypothetical protein